MVGRHFRFRLNKRRRTDNTVFTDHCAIHHHRVHPHQRITADNTPVQNGAVTNVPVLFHYRILIRKTMHHAVILDVRPIFHHDTAKITAQAGVGANINAFAQNHVANQYRRRVNIALFRHHRRQAVNLINRHTFSLCDIQTTKTLIIERAGRRQFPDRGFTFFADKRQRSRRNALVDVDTQLPRALPRPVRREQFLRQERIFQHHAAVKMNQ